MDKALTPKRAPGGPVAEPGLVKQRTQKKKKKKRFWKNKAREVNDKPGSNPQVVAVRPPKAPEDFSQNWKALQELLKQKPQAPEKPIVISQMDSKKQAKINQNRKAKREEVGTEKTDQEAIGGPVPPESLRNRKVPAPPTKASGAELNEKGSKKRTNGDIAPKQGDIKHKKRKTKVTAALAPAPPTEEDIWFDDVDPEDIEAAIGPEAATIARRQLGQSECDVTLVKEQAFGGLTKALGMDCEMVGVGPTGEDSIVARVSIVNQFGKCVYDKYVKPTQQVTDYRTAVSGIRPENLKQGEQFEVVQKEVAEMLKGRILVGHALHNDLKVLFLDHPKKEDSGHTEIQTIQGSSEEWKAVSEAARGENPGNQAAAGRALLDSGCPGSNETVCHREEGVGTHSPGQTPSCHRSRQRQWPRIAGALMLVPPCDLIMGQM